MQVEQAKAGGEEFLKNPCSLQTQITVSVRQQLLDSRSVIELFNCKLQKPSFAEHVAIKLCDQSSNECIESVRTFRS